MTGIEHEHHQHDHKHDHQHDHSHGLLLENVLGYNAFNAIFFLGRRNRHDGELIDAARIQRGWDVLDVGSGPGQFAERIARRTGGEGSVLGIDPSAKMIEYASAHAGRQPNCTFRAGLAQSLDLPDSAFDAVTLTFAMHHIPADVRAAAVAEFHRVLRPGGTLLIADLHRIGRVRPALLSAMMKALRRSHAPFAHTDVRQYTDLLTEHGFADVRFGTVAPWTGYLVAQKRR